MKFLIKGSFIRIAYCKEMEN